ncbi:hypothetical protein CBF23_008935 [Marinomonas agarivorans]|nr:hypothetical protein CBF23_008935 [Marinomonas agarivorans]
MSNGPLYEANIAAAPAFSVAAASVSMANSIGILMENAVNNESQSQSIQNASVSQCCVLMLAAGAAGASKGL